LVSVLHLCLEDFASVGIRALGTLKAFWVSQEMVQTFYQTSRGQLGIFED